MGSSTLSCLGGKRVRLPLSEVKSEPEEKKEGLWAMMPLIPDRRKDPAALIAITIRNTPQIAVSVDKDGGDALSLVHDKY